MLNQDRHEPFHYLPHACPHDKHGDHFHKPGITRRRENGFSPKLGVILVCLVILTVQWVMS